MLLPDGAAVAPHRCSPPPDRTRAPSNSGAQRFAKGDDVVLIHTTTTGPPSPPPLAAGFSGIPEKSPTK
ncbi:hypothetical protein Pta02_75110 [Planobispora takensis]|uniref:Uncharacterized protein n=1 Tax=Planobispora takensis TaxID=1367882 RepID=A0A8J3T4E5_9ACTN|nr:hypothetical protein Pta02_75110 [Planobispora takensis]